MTSPNMLLPIPSVLVTTDPLWAEYINDSLELIDAHDHSPGKGVQITPAGLNINADLPFNENDATELRTVRFADQASTPAGLEDEGIIYMKNGEFCYKDLDGNEVQLTLNGTINVSAGVGVISGLVTPASASYSTINGTFSWLKDTSKPAKMIVSDLIIYEFDDATAFPVTIRTDNVAAAYSMILPTVIPVAGEADGVLTIAYDGTMSATNRIALDRAPSAILFNSNSSTPVAAQHAIYSNVSTGDSYNNTTPNAAICEIRLSGVPANSTIQLDLSGDPTNTAESFYYFTRIGAESYFRAEVQMSFDGGGWTTIGVMSLSNNYYDAPTPQAAASQFLRYRCVDGQGEYAFRLRPYVGSGSSTYTTQNLCLHSWVMR